jgi:CO/xanthine dehydrogenase Mo-binding subunit
VIELAAAKADWKPGAQGDGATGRGFAFGQYKNGYGHIAMVCDIDVEHEPRVTRVVCAVDVGQIINPDGVVNQIEGGIIQAISWTLKEEVTFDRERVTSLDWDSYPILTFDGVPEIETHLISHPDQPPLGAGEVPAGPTAAAIANAVCHALGVRVRSLPLTRQRIIDAMDGK